MTGCKKFLDQPVLGIMFCQLFYFDANANWL